MKRSIVRLSVASVDRGLQAPKALAYARVSALEHKSPCIILVSPSLDQNVGSVARAMLNFGMSELRVVDPQCDILSPAARALSCGAELVLENAKIFPDLKSGIADLNRVMATTVRRRDLNNIVYSPNKAAEILVTNSNYETGIVFGRENNGMSNEEVALTDSIITIPTFNGFSSINLAQSVNIIGYEMWKQRIEIENEGQLDISQNHKFHKDLATKENTEFFLNRLEQKLTAANYRYDESQRKRNFKFIRTIFQRIDLGAAEVHMLQGVLTALTRDFEHQSNIEEKNEE